MAEKFDNSFIVKRLERPKGRINIVLDTDTYNEIDDQYAIAYILKNEDRLNLQAIYAAPFQNLKAENAAIGMQMSYDEIFNILKLMKRDDIAPKVFKGSDQFLPNETTPVESDAAKDLIKKAMEAPDDKPLYVVAIGAITNVASALIMKPEIAKKIVIVWLGGHSFDWHDTKEFNMKQDIASARVVFNSGAPVVLLPCMGVVSHLATTGPELEYWLKGKNELCDYLCNITVEEANLFHQGLFWSRVIWDVSAVAWVLDSDGLFDRLEASPVPAYDGLWSFDKTRHPIKYVYALKRDKIFEDLFTKLAQ